MREIERFEGDLKRWSEVERDGVREIENERGLQYKR